jgi:hypothetical protein
VEVYPLTGISSTWQYAVPDEALKLENKMQTRGLAAQDGRQCQYRRILLFQGELL